MAQMILLYLILGVFTLGMLLANRSNGTSMEIYTNTVTTQRQKVERG